MQTRNNFEYLLQWLDEDRRNKQYKEAEFFLEGAYSPKKLDVLTEEEQESIKYIFDGKLDNELVQHINTILEIYKVEESDFESSNLGQESKGNKPHPPTASGNVLERTQHLLLLLRYAINCLYETSHKYFLHGSRQQYSVRYRETVKKLYEEEFEKLDKSDTLAYLVFCMKNEVVWHTINGEVSKENGVNNIWKKIESALSENNSRALKDFNYFIDIFGQSGQDFQNAKQLLPWVYGSGATGDDLPPHLEWAYTAFHDGEQIQTLSGNPFFRTPLNQFGDPSRVLYRVCKPLDPKMLVAGQERITVGTRDNELMEKYVDYLHKGYQQFLTAAKEIPEKNRSRVLEMAKKTQLKEALELKEEFEALLPFIEQGRAFHTYEQYSKMHDLVTMNFSTIKSFFLEDFKKLTAKEFANELKKQEEQKEGWSFFSTLTSTVKGIFKIITFTFKALLGIIKWTAGGVKATWNYLASTKAGQWAIAAVGDPVKAAKQVRWIAGILQYAAIGFGQYLGTPRETLVAEGDETTMRTLYNQKLIEAEDDVAEIRGKAYDWLLKELKEKKKQELGEDVSLEQIGFDDPVHYKTLEKKVEVDFPPRRIFELKEHDKVKGYWRITERWSFLGVLSSYAQTYLQGMIAFDWSLYKKDLDNRNWWGGILSWLGVLGTVVKNAFNKFTRSVTHFSVNKALTGLTDYFSDKDNLKSLTEGVSTLVDSAAALAPLGGPATMLVAGAAKLALRSAVNHVAETVKEECKYALAMNDYWFLLEELIAIFDMRMLVDNLFAGSVKGFVSFNSLTLVNLIYWLADKFSRKVIQIKGQITIEEEPSIAPVSPED